MLKRLLAAVALIALCALSIVRVARPPHPIPATAADTLFSAERALRHVEEIAVRPHALGMPDHDRVRDYIMGQLTVLGLHPRIQQTTAVGTRYQEAGRVQNILASIPGSDSKGKAVLLMAHYDGVEAGPAASDDGAGAAALLETVRALRARKTALLNDVIVLFTDGEEAGLLGAAAFVREHPWAKDVAVVANFEARGTTGRSFMFETGTGNLDVVRALRSVGDVTAGSVFTAVYRMLPNDTDLSELAVLGRPGLNFAFADGVELNHTSHDDLAHLNPGSLQHHGSQMLALARIFGSEPLPRPVTHDAIFFDLPLVGLVVYPEGFALPLAALALVLVGVVAFRQRRGVVAGVITTLIAVGLANGGVRVVATFLHFLQSHLPSGGVPAWSGAYACALALFATAMALACYAMARRWSTAPGLHAGVLIVWLIIAIGLSVAVPGASYLFVWPLLFSAAADLAPLESRRRMVLQWLAAAAAILLIVGFTYGAAALTLGVVGAGASLLGVLISLVALLVAPQLEFVSRDKPGVGAAVIAVAGIAMVVVGLLTVRLAPDHPVPTALAYVENADSPDAWLGSFGSHDDAWTRSAIGSPTPVPDWTNRLSSGRAGFTGRATRRVPLDAPNATLVRDTIINGARRVVLRVKAPTGTTALLMRASGAKVSTSSIDDRIVDTTRYRFHSTDWTMRYWAVPDSGAIVALSIPPGSSIDFELVARRPGLPIMPGASIPPRPAYVVEWQTGDASYVYRRLRF